MLIIFITDGNPNTIGYESQTSVTEPEAVNAMLDEKATLEGNGVRIIAVGISDVDEANIQLLATGNTLNQDYFLPPDFESLQDVIQNVIQDGLCVVPPIPV